MLHHRLFRRGLARGCGRAPEQELQRVALHILGQVELGPSPKASADSNVRRMHWPLCPRGRDAAFSARTLRATGARPRRRSLRPPRLASHNSQRAGPHLGSTRACASWSGTNASTPRRACARCLGGAASALTATRRPPRFERLVPVAGMHACSRLRPRGHPHGCPSDLVARARWACRFRLGRKPLCCVLVVCDEVCELGAMARCAVRPMPGAMAALLNERERRTFVSPVTHAHARIGCFGASRKLASCAWV